MTWRGHFDHDPFATIDELGGAPPYWVDDPSDVDGYWVVSRYEDVREALQDRLAQSFRLAGAGNDDCLAGEACHHKVSVVTNSGLSANCWNSAATFWTASLETSATKASTPLMSITSK